MVDAPLLAAEAEDAAAEEADEDDAAEAETEDVEAEEAADELELEPEALEAAEAEEEEPPPFRQLVSPGLLIHHNTRNRTKRNTKRYEKVSARGGMEGDRAEETYCRC